MAYSRTFAEFIKDSTFENLPQEARQAAKLFILDILGVMYAGARSKPAGLVENYVRKAKDSEGCTIIPSGFKANCLDAVHKFPTNFAQQKKEF